MGKGMEEKRNVFPISTKWEALLTHSEKLSGRANQADNSFSVDFRDYEDNKENLIEATRRQQGFPRKATPRQILHVKKRVDCALRPIQGTPG